VYRRQPEANNWHRFWRGPLPLDDIAKLYSSAKIVLNYHEDSQRKWGMWNNRIYEALGCGALLITDDALGLREEFGDAVVITAGGAETARLITHFLAHSDERRRIGSLGREIVRQRYVYSQWARAVREFYQRLLATRHHLEGHRDGASHQGRGHRPKFTVLMPVFERILGMREAIDSVLGQTLADWELIIADDGSRSPEVQRIVDAYRETPGVYVIRLPHRCQGAALNAAARLARGDYLCRLDSDDLLVPEALEILNGYIERYPEVGYFYSSRYVIDEAGDIIERHHKSIPFDSALLLKRYIANPLLCWKRQDFMAVGGFREEVKYAEDYDLALRMACRFRFQNIEEFLYQVRYHSGRRLSTSFSPEELRLAEAEVRATSGEALRAALAMRNRRSNE